MKKIFGLTLMTMAALSANAGVYTFKVTPAPNGAQVVINWLQSGKQASAVFKNGEVTFNESDFTPQYVKVIAGGTLYNRTLWLDPAKDLTVSVDDKKRTIDFSGDLANINNYLHKTAFASVGYGDGWKNEAKYIKSCDSAYNANKAKLKAAKLPAAFNAKETVRLKYATYNALTNYARFHGYATNASDYKPNAQFRTKLSQLMTIDDALLEYPDYGPFIANSVNFYISEMDGDKDKNFMAYADENIKAAKVKSFVVNDYVYNKIKFSGLDGMDELVSYFKANVTDEYDKKKFNVLYNQWDAVRASKPSPKFNCVDINGNKVSLGSLLGKYVYIDVWATWCGPCRGELPHLKRLEEKYHGKDIHFVSISCDQDKAAWEKMVKEKDMKGIQLIFGQGDTFMDQYVISGIPRFILLDRAGNIISANATRPSNAKTAEQFDELLAKPLNYEVFYPKMKELEKQEKEQWNIVFSKDDQYTEDQKKVAKEKMDAVREEKVIWARQGIEANYNDSRFLDVLNVYLFNFLTVDELSAMLDKFTPEVQQEEMWKSMKNYAIYKPLNAVGKKAFDFTYKDHKGKSVTLSKVAKKNKLVVIDFWASWCGPCRASMPHLKEVYAKYKKQGVEVVTLSIDEKADAWEKAFKELQLPWIDVCNLMGYKDELLQKYAVRGIPYQALLDSDLNFVAIGFYRKGALEEAIEKYLNK